VLEGASRELAGPLKRCSDGPPMQIREILEPSRIVVDLEGAVVRSKGEAIRLLASLMAEGAGLSEAELEAALLDRERLQSTGIGDNVAIPHTSLDSAAAQLAAVLLCPKGVEFEAIDGKPVTIVFGVIGPKRATGEHLKTLARISRLLRTTEARRELLATGSPEQAFAHILEQDKLLT
jgi:PTS system nitrogen regulatory IIA component